VICKSFLEFNKNPRPQPPLPDRERKLKIVFASVSAKPKRSLCPCLARAALRAARAIDISFLTN